LIENETRNKIQIIHCNARHHWIVEVKIYDSPFTYCDMETETVISNLFQWNKHIKPVINVSRSQKQKAVLIVVCLLLQMPLP